jgi:hypothetical protein
MKSRVRNLITFLLLLVVSELHAQGFSGKTSAVYLNYKAAPVSSVLPEIVWKTPLQEASFSNDPQITLSAIVRSQVALSELKLVVTTGGATMERPIELGNDRNEKVVELKYHFLDGETIFEIIAVNEKGGRVSDKRSVLFGKDNLALLSASRKDYALLFGTDRYDYWDNLTNPIYDVRTIAEVLKEKYNFEVEVIENATYEDMSEKLADYTKKQFSLQDQLFVFFAGHGIFDEALNEGYVVASNSLKTDPAKLSFLSHETIAKRLETIKCDHIFLTMDVCFGGAFDQVLFANRGDAYAEANDEEFLLRVLSKRTRKYLTSGGKQYVPDGLPGRHSPFATKFIQALKETGGGNDRLLTYYELYPYFIKLATEARSGSFGTDIKESDFVFITRQ